ncbi:hypothetical protein CDAR_541121, partial [Caerostris darwini]
MSKRGIFNQPSLFKSIAFPQKTKLFMCTAQFRPVFPVLYTSKVGCSFFTTLYGFSPPSP